MAVFYGAASHYGGLEGREDMEGGVFGVKY